MISRCKLIGEGLNIQIVECGQKCVKEVINSEMFQIAFGVSCYATEQKHSHANNLIDIERRVASTIFVQFFLLHHQFVPSVCLSIH